MFIYGLCIFDKLTTCILSKIRITKYSLANES